MGLFFDASTPADKRLLQDYDAAVDAFRNQVSEAMLDVAANHPSLAKPMQAAAKAVLNRPLPSEANAGEDNMRRLVLSSLTVETVFSKLKSHAESQEAFDAAMGVAQKMREISKATIGKPEFRPLTDAVLQAVAARKAEVAKDMDGRVFDLYVGEITRPAPSQKPAAPSAPKP